MPTPFDLLQDPATQVLLAMFAGLALWEALAPGRPLPRVRGWRLRALAAFATYSTGFWHGASRRVLDMLLLRDVSRQADPA